MIFKIFNFFYKATKHELKDKAMIQGETYHHKDNIKLVPTYFTPIRMAIIKKWGGGDKYWEGGTLEPSFIAGGI